MNGFVNTALGFSQSAIDALITQAEDTYRNPLTPPEGVYITGLQNGSSSANAVHNTGVLNDAFEAGGDNILIIPSSVGNVDDTWYTDSIIRVYGSKTITWESGAKLTQIFPSTNVNANVNLMQILVADVTLNQPMMDQGGQEREPASWKSGRYSTLAAYGTSHNLTVNGGILEGGASNNFQGGRTNTVFNQTTFRNCREHLIYLNGVGGSLDGNDLADGITFNQCIGENPGIGDDQWESNHCQLRNFKNVLFEGGSMSGATENGSTNYGILASGINGLTVNGTSFSGYASGLIWVGTAYDYNSSNITLNDVVATPRTDDNYGYVVMPGGASVPNLVFNNLDITKPANFRTGISATFNDSRFRISYYRMTVDSSTDAIFHNCTFDASEARPENTLAMEVSGTSTTDFTGTTTRIEPTNGHTFNWGPIPAS